jgi:hypothetical protein
LRQIPPLLTKKTNQHPLQLICRLLQQWTLSAALFGLLLGSPRVAWADDENTRLASFNLALQAADIQQVVKTLEKTHPNPPTQEEVANLATTVINAALSALDQAAQFQKDFPHSKQLDRMSGSLADTLSTVFGSMGFPVPPNRAADLGAWTRQRIYEPPSDIRFYMILERVAEALPLVRQRALYEELRRAGTPEPARSMARDALRKLDRIGWPLVTLPHSAPKPTGALPNRGGRLN